MKFVNITPMFIRHKEEICRDLAQLEKDGVITEIAFMMKLNPEGTPPADAVSPCVRNFEIMRTELRKHSDMPVGILIQAIIGHGYRLDTPPESFRKMKSMPPENPEHMTHIVCPLDPGFRTYFAETAEKLAGLKPDFMLIDDDFRMFAGRNGCFCSLHIAEFNRRTGGNDSPDSLAQKIKTDPEIALRYEKFVAETFADTLQILRATLDRFAPECSVYYCSCVPEIKYAARFANILAAKNKPAVVRINNGRYTTESMRNFPVRMYTTAHAAAVLRGKVPVILSEPDTCPHNPYSTSAALLNCHMAGSIIEGCNGSKHWITGLKSHEPESGLAYRRILTQYQGFYRTLHELVREKSDAGVVCPLPGENFHEFNIYHGEMPDRSPGIVAVLARMGIPVNYAENAGGLPVILNAPFISSWSDREIRTFLRNGAILDGPSAEALYKRGFGAQLGVRIEPFPPVKATHETGSDGITIYRPQPDGTLVRLIPDAEQTEVLSMLGSAKSQTGGNPEPIAPGMTFFRNPEGGAAAVFAGSPDGGPWLSEFAFLNQTRKQAILRILNRMNPLPVYHPGPEEIYCKLWDAAGTIHLPFFTLGRDDLPELELCVANMPDAVESLQPSGGWEPLAFRKTGTGRIVVESEFRATRPFVLRFPGIG